jgi:magnesium-transporting ATPase (P-type)
MLPTNGGEALTVIAAIMFGGVLPITPVQILWVNMVTAVTLALALAFEPAEGDVMRRAPRRPHEPILSGFLIWRVAFVSAILLLGTFGLFVWERSQGAEVELARTVAVDVLVMVEVAYLFNTRHLRDPVINRAGLFGSPPVLIAIGIVVGLQLLFTYAPPMQVLFDTRPVSLRSWCLIVLVAVAALILVEAEKWVTRRRYPAAT